MSEDLIPVHPLKRLAYAFVGLLAGIAAMFIFLLYYAMRERAALLAAHEGAPAGVIPATLQLFPIYAGFSLAGWILIGVPTVLVFSARSITRLPWLCVVGIGAILGPLALLPVFVLLGHGHFSFTESFRNTQSAWVFAVWVSTVSFTAYAALLRRG